jgi:hypothetical protein
VIPNSAAWIALAFAFVATPALAQTPAPQPGTPATITRGLVPRAGVHVGLIHLTAADPRFNWAARFGTDIDVYDYGKGRLSLIGEYEAVFGSERREFDLNHENYTVDISASLRAKGSEFFGVIHHVSRHLTDRQNNRAVAWNSVGVAASREFSRGGNDFRARLDLAHVFQHTFNDYTWTAWLTLAAERPAGSRATVFARANGGFQGVDRKVAGRDRLCGARIESGVHVKGVRGGFDVFVGYERRLDGYPLSYQRSRWVEWGARIGTR